jgi:ketosteroid isomerase-like protein
MRRRSGALIFASPPRSRGALTIEMRHSMTQNDDNGFGRARERVRTALAAMGFGNPEPYIDCWGKSDDATLFGAWGPIERGYARLTETFRWVGSRFKSGALVPQDIVCFESGDLAYTVGFEVGEVVVDRGPATPMTIRVTHIYRRIDGEWRLVHRHADFPPADQRAPA